MRGEGEGRGRGKGDGGLCNWSSNLQVQSEQTIHTPSRDCFPTRVVIRPQTRLVFKHTVCLVAAELAILTALSGLLWACEHTVRPPLQRDSENALEGKSLASFLKFPFTAFQFNYMWIENIPFFLEQNNTNLELKEKTKPKEKPHTYMNKCRGIIP